MVCVAFARILQRRWVEWEPRLLAILPCCQYLRGQRAQRRFEGGVFDAGNGGFDNSGGGRRGRGQWRRRWRLNQAVDKPYASNGPPAEKAIDSLADQRLLVLQLKSQRARSNADDKRAAALACRLFAAPPGQTLRLAARGEVSADD